MFDAENFYSGHTSGPHPVDPSKASLKNLYTENYLIMYVDHADWRGVEVPKSKDLLSKTLQPSIVLDTGCATNSALWGYLLAWNFWSSDKWVTFSTENLRRGAMVFMGAVDLSYWHRMFDDILIRCFMDGQTIGEAYLEARKEEYMAAAGSGKTTIWPLGDPYYALLGDPTFKPRWW